MKKENVFIIILFTILSVQLIIAQNLVIDRTIQGLVESFESIFRPILGPFSTGEFLFAKILLFFLLFAIIFMVLKRISLFEDNLAVHSIVSLIVSILAVRYIKENELVNAILLPYGSLGVAISIFLPLLIYFFFLHSSEMGGFGRRAGWLIYGIVFLVLWGSRPYDSLGVANWIYLIGIGFVLISLIFDKSVHQYFEMGKYNKPRRLLIERQIIELQNAVNDARKVGRHQTADKLEREIKKLTKRL